MHYNVMKKTFPDGTMQLMYYEKPKETGYKYPPEMDKDGLSVERKEKENASRAKRKVFEYVRSNSFDWFITFTFNEDSVDRYDYNSCADALKRYTDILYHRGHTWVIVAEQHKDGAYHFHGVISGDLSVVPAINPITGKQLVKNNRKIFNVQNFKYGFTTATKISDPVRTATYLSKYLSKSMSVPKGRKRYWASRGLSLPIEERLQMTSCEFGEIFNTDGAFTKVMDTEWGMFLFCEIKGDLYE